MFNRNVCRCYGIVQEIVSVSSSVCRYKSRQGVFPDQYQTMASQFEPQPVPILVLMAAHQQVKFLPTNRYLILLTRYHFHPGRDRWIHSYRKRHMGTSHQKSSHQNVDHHCHLRIAAPIIRPPPTKYPNITPSADSHSHTSPATQRNTTTPPTAAQPNKS